MDDDLLKTGDFGRFVSNIDEYVEMDKLEARARVTAKEGFLDDKKRGASSVVVISKRSILPCLPTTLLTHTHLK
jgi:hypothetical protein